VRRAALAFPLAVAVLAAACGEDAPAVCPGDPVATFHFSGTKVDAGDAALAGLEPDPALPDCPGPVGYPATGERLPPFDGTLARDPSTDAATLCRPREIFLFGQRTGSRYFLETGSTGAVLEGCSASCAAALRLLVAGEVVDGPDGEAAAFDGVLVEVITYVEGDCGECLPPGARTCAGRFTLDGTP
jgi:hypothetical protein